MIVKKNIFVIYYAIENHNNFFIAESNIAKTKY